MMSMPDFKYKQAIFCMSSHSGEKLQFRADKIVITDNDGRTTLQHSCHRVFPLFIVGNITVTSVLLEKARKFGFPVVLMSHNLRPHTLFNNRAEGNFLLRRKQYTNEHKDLDIAKRLIGQKIENQISSIEMLRYRSEEDKEAIVELKKVATESAHSTQELLGIEGNSSRTFFRTYFRNMDWTRREPRTKRNIPNFLLDMGYTYIFNFIESLLGIYGFDIYCGVYHKFFFQRKSLVCDLVEPFRYIIDRSLRKAYNLGQIDQNDFFNQDGRYYLKYDRQAKYTKIFMTAILHHKEEIFKFIQEYYRWFIRGKSYELFPKINNRVI